jgi:hypothetical protein
MGSTVTVPPATARQPQIIQRPQRHLFPANRQRFPQPAAVADLPAQHIVEEEAPHATSSKEYWLPISRAA